MSKADGVRFIFGSLVLLAAICLLTLALFWDDQGWARIKTTWNNSHAPEKMARCIGGTFASLCIVVLIFYITTGRIPFWAFSQSLPDFTSRRSYTRRFSYLFLLRIFLIYNLKIRLFSNLIEKFYQLKFFEILAPAFFDNLTFSVKWKTPTWQPFLRAYDTGMHLALIFPLAVLYLATKWKIFLLLLLIVVLPTCIHIIFMGTGGGSGTSSD